MTSKTNHGHITEQQARAPLTRTLVAISPPKPGCPILPGLVTIGQNSQYCNPLFELGIFRCFNYESTGMTPRSMGGFL